jgi:prepilin-type N-terminal cleavage/methylation domain-containing protein
MNQAMKIKKQLRAAFTLVEMLIAMALTLILVYAIAEFYAYIGTAVRDGRATIEMGGQLRAASQQLNDDLQCLTLSPTPWINKEAAPGYFTAYEGPCSDTYPDQSTDIVTDTDGDNVPDVVENSNVTNLIGDGDDILAFTIRAKDGPFQARVYDGSNYVVATSQFAEVIWFTTFVDSDGDGSWTINEPRFLCRRQLLILPVEQRRSLSNSNGTLPMPGNLSQFIQNAEVSFNINSSGNPVANTLADLALRQNRYGCQGASVTYAAHMLLNPTNSASLQKYTLQDITIGTNSDNKFGEDRVLSNLLAFDVRVFDPTAPIYQDSSGVTALAPGDSGYRTLVSAGGATAIGYGAWVDLSYNRTGMTGSSTFSGVPQSPFNLSAPSNPTTDPYNFHHWDTWPTYFENDGVSQDSSPPAWKTTIDQGVNGLDDDDQYGVDDAGERETQPPYSTPLRGIQVKIRIYEPQTRQMRQVTVGADFIE